MALVTLPDATTLIASTTAPAQALFDPTLPIVLFGLGFIIGAVVIVFALRMLMKGIYKIFGSGKRGGRRRRR